MEGVNDGSNESEGTSLGIILNDGALDGMADILGAKEGIALVEGDKLGSLDNDGTSLGIILNDGITEG